ncbi:retrovirus-related pol polyprotein from transposon TNT 1-94 [Tanacetum coccineum]
MQPLPWLLFLSTETNEQPPRCGGYKTIRTLVWFMHSQHPFSGDTNPTAPSLVVAATETNTPWVGTPNHRTLPGEHDGGGVGVRLWWGRKKGEWRRGNPQQDLQKKGVIDSGCSRHMIGNMSYLTDFEEIDGGYVTFRGTPKGGKITGRALGFMRPFRCPVTILNTIDHLSKFDGKADKGFFVGYSINSKAFRVFNSRTRIVEENLHVQFSENTPNIAGSTKACDDAGKARMETIPGEDYIMLPLWTANPPFSQSSKSSPDAGFKPSSDDDTNNVNAASTNEVNAVGGKTSIELLDDPNMPALEDIVYSDDDEDVGAEADMNNLDAFMPVSPIPTTRVHKDHPVEQIIGDLNSAPQTRRMTKNLEEHGLFSSVQQRTNHKDFQNCLFACFLSQVEPKKVIQALQDSSWMEAMQDELLQFKLQKVDVNSAFLYGKIEEEVYVCQPSGFEDPDFPNRKSLCTEFEKMMHKKFQMKSIGEQTFFLGLQVKQNEDGIFINQDKYMTEILKKFGFTDVKTASTPMETQKIFLKDEDGEEVDVHLYRSMIGSLMYLNYSRPDIMFAVCGCARYQVNPKVSHLHAVKRIFSVYAGASLDRKSTTGVNAARHNLLLLFKVNAARHNLLLLLKVNAARHKLTTAVESENCQWKFLIHTILQCLSAKTTAWNEFSSTMASAIICLAANKKFNFLKYIFESMVKNLENVSGKFLMYPRFVQVFFEKQLEGMSNHKRIYVTPSHTKKIFRNIRRVGKGFSGRETPLFPTMMVQAQEEMGEDNVADEAVYEEMDDSLERAATTATSLDAEQDRGNINKTQSKETLNEPSSLGTSLDLLSLGDYKFEKEGQETIEESKGRIDDIDANEDIYLVNVHRDEDIFGVNDLKGDEVIVETKVDHEVVVKTEVASKDVNLSVDEVTLAQALTALKSAKPKADKVMLQEPEQGTITTTTAATTVTAASTRPKVKGIVIHEHEQAPTPTVSSQQPSQVKVQDKGKGIMVEEPLKMKKKDQISFDEQEAIRLQAKFDEEERLAREKDEANVALTKE